MTCEKDKVVSINYTLKDDDGNVVDTCVGGAPLEYVHGRNFLLTKLEELITGKNPGDKFSCVLPPEDGYGEYKPELVVEVPRSEFDTSVSIEPGMAFQAMTEAGPAIVLVKEVKDDVIVIDGNNDMAGKTLHFDIEILDVREATEDELASGMVGGGCGGCGGGCGGDCNCDGGCGDGGCGGGCGN